MPDCKNCEQINWKNHYLMAQKSFDRALTKAIMISMISFTIAVCCLIATICVIFKFVRFINDFEYVEEQTIEIQQDWRGDNRVILDNGMGVVEYGTEICGEDKEILEEENGKINTININK